MSNYSDPITATGSLISVQNRFGGLVDSLSVPITPVQDLHGYSKPWAAGAGKNKLFINASSQTKNGITMTVNSDGSIKLNGTATAYTFFNLNYVNNSTLSIPAGTYYANGGIHDVTYRVYVNGSRVLDNTAIVDREFTVASGATSSYLRIDIVTGKSFDNETFYPMIRLTSETDQTWEPYANICPISGSTGLSAYRNGRNFLAYPYYHPTRTYNGITYTVHDDGSITLTGEATGNSVTSVVFNQPLPNGSYVFRLSEEGGSYTGLIYVRFQQHSADAYVNLGVNEEKPFTVDDGNFYLIQIRTNSTTKITSPVTVYPMFRLSTDTDTTWEPYTSATYAEDWTSQAGTVYAGSIDIVSGSLKARPQYASYNGETLIGPWLSSLDEYAAGATPTTGAQVVDLGGTETPYQLTAQDVALLIGQNYLWASNSEVMTMIYRLWLKDRETGATSIGKNAESLTVTPQFNGVSKVVINITPELAYEAGNDTGRTITIDCPWGTQAMANNLLTMLEGFQYQPYEAENALLDPSAELGDGLTVNGVYGGIFKMTVRSGVLHAVDVSSPQDEEIDHEYPFVASSERKIERQLANVKSELSVQADQISAKVDREGGDPSSVSWEMNADQFKILSDGSEVLIIDDNGLTVNGDGNFTGDVHAGNIKYGGSSGHFSGSGISSKSIGTGQTNDGIQTSLGNADYSAGVFSGATEATYVKAKNLYCVGEFKYNGTVFAPATYYVLDGNDNKVKVRLFKQKDNPS